MERYYCYFSQVWFKVNALFVPILNIQKTRFFGLRKQRKKRHLSKSKREYVTKIKYWLLGLYYFLQLCFVLLQYCQNIYITLSIILYNFLPIQYAKLYFSNQEGVLQNSCSVLYSKSLKITFAGVWLLLRLKTKYL